MPAARALPDMSISSRYAAASPSPGSVPPFGPYLSPAETLDLRSNNRHRRAMRQVQVKGVGKAGVIKKGILGSVKQGGVTFPSPYLESARARRNVAADLRKVFDKVRPHRRQHDREGRARATHILAELRTRR